MSVLVGVSAQENARYTMFFACLSRLHLPPGSSVEWAYMDSIAENRNSLIRKMLAGEYQWLWFLDDDHAFYADALSRLLERDVDIVQPLCLSRTPPFSPVHATGWADPEQDLRHRLDLDNHPEGGLVEVMATGTGGMLVRREVFEQLDDPWFAGIAKGSDLLFCDDAVDAGFHVYVDLDVMFGHIASPAIFPLRPAKPGDPWGLGMGFGDGQMIIL